MPTINFQFLAGLDETQGVNNQFWLQRGRSLPRQDLIQDIQLVQLNTQVSTSNASLIGIDSNNPEFVEHFEPKIIQTMSNVEDNAFALENDVTYPANNNDMLFEPINFSTPNDNMLADGYFPLEIKKNQEQVAESSTREQQIEEVDVSYDDSVKDPDFDSGDAKTEKTSDDEITKDPEKKTKNEQK
ncbi:hypothetical protein ILUMI_26422 [Ignelater luminosus]|uniref:Uncharacterized protein n=1 Tax=Ignelater luminosus TaxID=2038154 RepID=A0A8K0FVX8_IGNLU|nr:hypothetical protein ILUMI_26422 [Ignelater luminosus]